MSNGRIILDESLLLAEGSERKCYLHPSLPGHCIKVPVKAGLGKKCPQCRVDLYNARRLKARRVPMLHTVDCLGWIDTNLGPALLTERVMDEDGSASMSLQESLESGNLKWEDVDRMLKDFWVWAYRYSVVVSELNIKNLMHRAGSGGGRLVVVDGLGGRKPDLVFYLRQHLPWLARKKTMKRWSREYGKVKSAVLKLVQKSHDMDENFKDDFLGFDSGVSEHDQLGSVNISSGQSYPKRHE